MAFPYAYPGPKRLAAALSLAGFSNSLKVTEHGTALRTMMGIAYAESSGNALEVGDNKNSRGVVTSNDYGIWQINDYYEGDRLLKSLPDYKDYTIAQLREKWGVDPRNTFYAYQRLSKRSWASWTDNAVMARVSYLSMGFKAWVAYTSGALDNPDRVFWAHVDYGIAKMNEELERGFVLERVASLYLELLDTGPLKQ